MASRCRLAASAAASGRGSPFHSITPSCASARVPPAVAPRLQSNRLPAGRSRSGRAWPSPHGSTPWLRRARSQETWDDRYQFFGVGKVQRFGGGRSGIPHRLHHTHPPRRFGGHIGATSEFGIYCTISGCTAPPTSLANLRQSGLKPPGNRPTSREALSGKGWRRFRHVRVEPGSVGLVSKQGRHDKPSSRNSLPFQSACRLPAKPCRKQISLR